MFFLAFLVVLFVCGTCFIGVVALGVWLSERRTRQRRSVHKFNKFWDAG